MISILIVEDRPEKLRDIAVAIRSIPGISEDDIFVAECVHTAKKLLSSKRFDLLILDMHLPPKLGDDPKMDAGLELLESLRSGGRFNLPFHIIAVTEYEEAKKLSEREMDLQLWGTVVYKSNNAGWKKPLVNKISYLIGSKRSMAEDEASGSLCTLAIITALKEELEAVSAFIDGKREVRFPGDPTLYLEGSFSEAGQTVSVVAATTAKMGMAAAATLTTKIISRYRPRYMAMAGIAAGIPGRVSIGDILVADPSWDWGAGKFEVVDGVAKFSADPEQLRIQPSLRGWLSEMVDDAAVMFHIRNKYPGPKVGYDLRAHVGGVASGAAVIGNAQVVDSIKAQKRKMIGIEMEAYGLMAAVDACPEPRPQTFAAKSVSDYADTDKDDTNRHYANYTSAAFIREFALKYLST